MATEKQAYDGKEGQVFMTRNGFIIKIAALVFYMLVAIKSDAQLKGDHLLGDFGLNAGSQPPPTVIGALPFLPD